MVSVATSASTTGRVTLHLTSAPIPPQGQPEAGIPSGIGATHFGSDNNNNKKKEQNKKKDKNKKNNNNGGFGSDSDGLLRSDLIDL